MPLTALDVQLRQRLLQRRLDRGHFLRDMIFFHRRLRACDRGFGSGFVVCRRFQRHVRQNRNRLAGDLGKSFADGERGLPAALQNAQLARLERCQHWHMLRINAQLTVRAGEHDHLDVFGIGFRLRSNDFQSQRFHFGTV